MDRDKFAEWDVGFIKLLFEMRFFRTNAREGVFLISASGTQCFFLSCNFFVYQKISIGVG